RERPRVVEAAAALPELMARGRVLGRRVLGRDDIGLRHGDARQRRRLDRERLRRGVPFARHVALRHGPLLDRDHGLAVLAVEHEHVARLADVHEARDALAVDDDVEQRSGGRHVRIPQIVVDRLKVPEVLARGGLDRDDRIREKIDARAIAPVVVRRGTRDREVDDAAGRVDRGGERPHVRPGAVLPTVAPRFVERLAGLRDGLKLPELLARANIERARVPGRALRHLVDVRADHRDVAVDRRRAAVRYADVDAAAVAESGRGLAGRGVERVELGAGHEQNPRRVLRVAFPVAHAARRYAARAALLTFGTRNDEDPTLLAGLAV